MNVLVDRHTAQISTESRRLWGDTRVWVVNCLAVEAALAEMSIAERAAARRGCDRMLAAFLEVW